MKVLCAWGGGASWTRTFSPPASWLRRPSLLQGMWKETWGRQSGSGELRGLSASQGSPGELEQVSLALEAMHGERVQAANRLF